MLLLLLLLLELPAPQVYTLWTFCERSMSCHYFVFS